MRSPIALAPVFAVLAPVFAVLALSACSKSEPAASAASEPGPWSNVAHVEIGRFGVNEPRSDGRACWTARYTVDLKDRTLHVETCIDDDPIARDVTLADADVLKIRASLARMTEARAASQCTAASSAYIVEMYDAAKLAQFTDSSNACHAGDMGTIDRKGLDGLFATLAAIEPTARS